MLSKSIICDLTHSPIVLPLRNVVWLLLRGCYVVVVIVNDVVLILKIYKSPPLSLSLSLSIYLSLSPPLSLSLFLSLSLSPSLLSLFLGGGISFWVWIICCCLYTACFKSTLNHCQDQTLSFLTTICQWPLCWWRLIYKNIFLSLHVKLWPIQCPACIEWNWFIDLIPY